MDEYLDASIIDVEMENRAEDKKELPRRHRYYESLDDSKSLETSTPYEKLPNYVSITISSYDPFDANDMCYVATTVLASHLNIPYDDGVMHLYFYCKGRPNFDEIIDAGLIKSISHSKKLQEMLEYIVSGKKPATSDPDIDAVDNVVTKVKNKKEVTTKYMRWFDEIRHYKMDERINIALKDIKFDRENGISAEVTRNRLREWGYDDVEIDELMSTVAEDNKSVKV